ncbi:calpain-A-like isoform X3 [Oratosquilla oratoria]|uniref:calpain-A-like isoform X3 n=1 Tax=Oratosquilla oratoria TaxID=337810 RepID=UPI003F7724B8
MSCFHLQSVVAKQRFCYMGQYYPRAGATEMTGVEKNCYSISIPPQDGSFAILKEHQNETMSSREEQEEEVVEVFEVGKKEDHDRHCHCYIHDNRRRRFPDEPESLPDEVKEEPCLVKSAYYSRVKQEYSYINGTTYQTKRIKPSAAKGFQQLRLECLKNGTLYEDPDFPAESHSINFNGITRRNYVWKRPHEIAKNPALFVEGASRFDIQQGELGDCWLLAAVSNLTLTPKLFHYVVPRDQGFQSMYAGIFHFRFWQYGKWEEVVIDDRLPTYYNQLAFMHSKTKNEFWCALLEKAYAKMYGGYEALRGGNISEAMVDLTGGVVEMVDIRQPPPQLFRILHKAYRRGALVGCAIEPENPNVAVEAILSNGLLQRHAYSITRVTEVSTASTLPLVNGNQKISCGSSNVPSSLKETLVRMTNMAMGVTLDKTEVCLKVPKDYFTRDTKESLEKTLARFTNMTMGVTLKEDKIQLLRLYNPWGNEAEWKGAWSDKSPEWNSLSAEEKARLGITFDDDGEFWMTYQDLISNFTTIEICDMSPEAFEVDENDEDLLQNLSQEKDMRWKMVMFEGAWVNGVSAGGCRNFLNTFSSNPQYMVVLDEPDEDDDENTCTLAISLMQKNVRQLKRYGIDYVPIGFVIYKFPENGKAGQKLDTNFFRYNGSVDKCPYFLNVREVFARFKLPPGPYVIIPSTFDPGHEGEFLLRIFTETKKSSVMYSDM